MKANIETKILKIGEVKKHPKNPKQHDNELIDLMDKIDLDELGVKSAIEHEIARFNKFRIGVLGHKQEKQNSDINVRNYTKYLLREGTLIEKRELLYFLKSKLVLKDKKIILE